MFHKNVETMSLLSRNKVTMGSVRCKLTRILKQNHGSNCAPVVTVAGGSGGSGGGCSKGTPQKVVFSDLQNKISGLEDGLKFHIETYGCQMNVADSEIVRSILTSNGHHSVDTVEAADVILTNTCAIRENAEEKVWHRLTYFQSMRKKNRGKGEKAAYPVIGVLGCMAERLKKKLLLEESVDFVCGPDAYRDIPRLLEGVVSAGQKEANTMLSLEETYADINPIREVNSCSAFVSIMRGCNNMCSFCIVPFTRGRERSRPMASILQEVRNLSESGVKEVVLLGQNVNGYHDISDTSVAEYPETKYKTAEGFNTMYKIRSREKPGARFADLLVAISAINPEMRIRFTSPHPKDFPTEVLSVIAEKRNICASLHLPIQSGSTSCLSRMRRGYSREAFLDLVKTVRREIPGVSISTDVIAGFCGETEEEHRDTVTAMKEVRFDQAFMFAYSLREKTNAANTMVDDVPEDVKQRRLQEIIDVFRAEMAEKNYQEEHGQLRLVLVEGPATKSTPENPTLTGRTDGNKRVVFPATNLFTIPQTFIDSLDSSKYSGNNSDKVVNTQALDLLRDQQFTTQIHSHHVNPAEKQNKTTTLAELLFPTSDFHKELSGMPQEDIDVWMRRGLEHIPYTSTDVDADGAVTTEGAKKSTMKSTAEVLAQPLVSPKDIVGQYVLVRILKSRTPTLKGVAVAVSSVEQFSKLEPYLNNKVIV